MKRLLLLLITLPGIARAGIITDFQTSPASQTNYPVSSTDLINSGSASLFDYSDPDYVPSPIDSYGGISALIDGDAGGITGFMASPGGVMDLDGTWSFLVDLNLANSPLGYDITNIQTFTGHTDNRKSQSYALFASLVGDSSFFQIGTFDFNYDTPNPGSTRLSISDSSGLIASGVDALRWDVQMPSSGFATVYREFDVFGSPSIAAVPEPATLTVWTVFGVAGLLYMRRHKRR